MIKHNIEQRSEEWFEIRKGKMTASHAQAIASNGKGLKTYIRKVMREIYESNDDSNQYKNKHIERGNENEKTARLLYEFNTGIKPVLVGFLELNENIGCSPDGLVGDDGLIEIKCPANKGYFDLLLDGKIQSKYIWQMQMQMYVSGRDWCDFVAYNPNFEQQLFIKRIEKDLKAFEKLEKGFESGIEMMKEIKNKIGEKL